MAATPRIVIIALDSEVVARNLSPTAEAFFRVPVGLSIVAEGIEWEEGALESSKDVKPRVSKAHANL